MVAKVKERLAVKPKPSAFEVKMATGKLKRHKSPGIDQIPSKMIKARSRTIHSEIHTLINSIWNREDWSEELEESIIAPVYQKGDKADYSNHRGISLSSTAYKTLSSILLSRLTPYEEEITGELQFGFQCNMSTTDHLICIYQLLE